jgi:hypothetical protein
LGKSGNSRENYGHEMGSQLTKLKKVIDVVVVLKKIS